MKRSGVFKIKIIFIISLIISILFCTVITSCQYEDLGLEVFLENGDTENDNNNGSEVPIEEEQAITEEFFLKLKAKQSSSNPLKDINIRKAIFYAIDREKIVEELFGKYGDVAESLFTEDSQYWSDSWSCYSYDPEIAAEYLARAGYGLDNPLYITIGAVDNSESKQLVEDIIKEDLEKIGIDIWVFNKPPKEWYQDFVRNGEYEIGIWSLLNTDGSTLENSFSSEKIPPMETEDNIKCENFYWYNSDQIDEVFTKLEYTKEIEDKKDLFAGLQDILANDAVILPLYNRLFVVAYNTAFEKIDFEVIDNHLRFDIGNWTESENTQVSEENGSEIRIGCQSEEIDLINSFEPYCINDLVFEGLWKIGEDDEYSPVLVGDYVNTTAEITEIQNPEAIQGLEKIITLREDIYWDDGTSLTTEDVLYTYNFFISVLEESEYFYEIDKDYLKIEKIEIIDEKTFRMIFKDIVSDWQKLFDIIIKKDTFLDRNINYFPLEDISGCGPYSVVEYNRDGFLLLEVNEYYHEDRPQIDNIRVIFDPDIHNLIAMLKEGELDVLSIPVDKTLMEDLETSGDFNLVIKQGSLLDHIALCLKPVEE